MVVKVEEEAVANWFLMRFLMIAYSFRQQIIDDILSQQTRRWIHKNNRISMILVVPE